MPQIAQTDTKSREFSSLCLKICFNQSEGPPRFGQRQVSSMEFQRSFLRRHLGENQWWASRNVGCFEYFVRLVLTLEDWMEH